MIMRMAHRPSDGSVSSPPESTGLLQAGAHGLGRGGTEAWMSRSSRTSRAACLALVVGAVACGRQGLDLGARDASGAGSTTGVAGTTGAAGTTPAAGVNGHAGTIGGAGTTGGTSGEGSDPTLPLAPTPNQIRCGAATCPVETDYCCSSADDTFDLCSPTFCGVRRECDETADCLPGEVCCYRVFLSPPPAVGSTCVPKGQCSFEGLTWIACSSQSDCQAEGAPACVAQQCRSATLQTCGPITRTDCKN
jgi:hypothetical protein